MVYVKKYVTWKQNALYLTFPLSKMEEPMRPKESAENVFARDAKCPKEMITHVCVYGVKNQLMIQRCASTAVNPYTQWHVLLMRAQALLCALNVSKIKVSI